MSLFKKEKKELEEKAPETITFSVEDARAMVEGKYNDTFKEIRLNFWKNVKKNAMEGKSSYRDFEYLYDHSLSRDFGEDIVKIYRAIAAEFESFGFRVVLEERITEKENCRDMNDYLFTRLHDKVELRIYWDKESEDKC